MAVAAASNGGIYGQKGKALQGIFGGASGNAILSDSESGTLTINGINYKYYTFTSTTTFTVIKSGAAQILAVGGGGGGNEGSGGTGGGFIERAAILDTGVYTVTVGGGGSANGGTGGTSSIIIGAVTILSAPGGTTGNRYGNTSGPTGSSGFGAQGPQPGINGWVGVAGGDGSGTTIYNGTGNFFAGGGSGGGYNAAGSSYSSRGGGGAVGVGGSSGTGGGGGGNNQAAGGQAGGSGRVVIRVQV